MDAYRDYQAQQMGRAKTFAEIRRIEERVSEMAQVARAQRFPASLRVAAEHGNPGTPRCRVLMLSAFVCRNLTIAVLRRVSLVVAPSRRSARLAPSTAVLTIGAQDAHAERRQTDR
jgi:hypothetical protein